MTERTFLDMWQTLFALIVVASLAPLGVANAQSTEPSPSASEFTPPHASEIERTDADRPQDTPPVISQSADAPIADEASASRGQASGAATQPAQDEAAADSVKPATSIASTTSEEPRTQVNVSEKGLRVTSADGRFALGLSPFVQMGYRQVASDFDDSNNSGFVLTHFRPTLTGKYSEYLSYNFILNITPSSINVIDAFVTFHAHKRLNIRVGLQKPVFGIELRQAQPNVLFINRSMAATIGSSRDIGLALDARPIDNLQIEAGVYNGTEDTRVFSGIQERSVGADAGVRWYALGNDRPTTQDEGFLTLGAAALLRRNEGNATTSHLTPRSSAAGHTYSNYAPGAFADGRKFASTVFAHGGYKGLYFQGEFTTSNQQVSDASDQGRIVEHGWAAAATYTIGGITGWSGTTPNRSLFEGGLGALQIKARGHGLTARARGGDFLNLAGATADSVSAIGASAGLSWFVSPGVRFIADYNWTTFGVDATRLKHANEHSLYIGLAAGY